MSRTQELTAQLKRINDRLQAETDRDKIIALGKRYLEALHELQRWKKLHRGLSDE